MQTASSNQATAPPHLASTTRVGAFPQTSPCRRVRQWPSHAPQKLQDFEDCDYSAHAAESSIRHGSPACA